MLIGSFNVDQLKITRNQYDMLLQKYPDWMRTEWLRYHRQWNTEGVKVAGSYIMIVRLYQKLLNVKPY